MSVSDPIADFLTSIRNGCRAKKEEVLIPSSKQKEHIASILKEEGFISNYKVIEEGPKKVLKIYLKYLRDGKPAIKNLRKVTRPSLRRYTEAQKIPRVLNGMGIMIVSTSRGIMTDAKARKENVGGEMICTVS
jgi:small subunit ribosomal protein S8